MILSNGAYSGNFKAVADLRFDVLVSESFEAAGGRLDQRLDDFDGVDLFDERAEDGGLIAAAGADLKHLVGRPRVELFGPIGR